MTDFNIEPRDLDRINNAAYISGALPYIRAEIESMVKSVQTRVFAAMRDDTYSPELADGAWRELHAYARLIKRLESSVRIGQSTGDQLKDEMTGADPNG